MRRGRTWPPPSSQQAGQRQPRAAIPAVSRKDAYCGTCMLLLSIVTAARAKALPDRPAPVFIVMLE
jgi:hypothetical protein